MEPMLIQAVVFEVGYALLKAYLWGYGLTLEAVESIWE